MAITKTMSNVDIYNNASIRDFNCKKSSINNAI